MASIGRTSMITKEGKIARAHHRSVSVADLPVTAIVDVGEVDIPKCGRIRNKSEKCSFCVLLTEIRMKVEIF